MNYDWPDDIRYRTYMTRHMPDDLHGELNRLATEMRIPQEAVLAHALAMGLVVLEVEILEPRREKRRRKKVQVVEVDYLGTKGRA